MESWPKVSTDLKVNDQVEIRFGNKVATCQSTRDERQYKKKKMQQACMKLSVKHGQKKMSKNIVQLNNSFIQNEYQRRRYLMKERQNGIVLWGGY